MKLLSQTLERLKTLRAEHDSVAEAASRESLQRLPWVLGTVILTLLLGALANWNLVAQGTPAAFAGKNIPSWLNLILAAWLLAAALLMRFGRLTHRGAVSLILIVALSNMLILTARATVDQWGSNSVTMFTLGCIFVGTLLLIRPLHAIVLYGLSYAVFYFAIGLTQLNLGLLHVNQAQGFAAAALGLVLSILLWRKHTEMTLLQRSLQAANDTLQKQQLQLQALAQHDVLTGLFNRGKFAERARMELLRARRDPCDTAVIMADLDFFKRVNDTYGHPAGDEVIKAMATALRTCVRGTDVIARMGGEEFIVLLPNTSLAAAMVVAEKIRELVQQTPIHIEAMPDIHVTASFGVTGLVQNQPGSLEALYAAKNLGRNRVERCAVANIPAPGRVQ